MSERFSPFDARDIAALAGAAYAQADDAYANSDLDTLALAVKSLAECVGYLADRLETDE